MSDANRALIASWLGEDEVATLAHTSMRAMILNGLQRGVTNDFAASLNSGWDNIAFCTANSLMGKSIVCFSSSLIICIYEQSPLFACDMHAAASDGLLTGARIVAHVCGAERGIAAAFQSLIKRKRICDQLPG